MNLRDTIFTTKEAADYLGISAQAMKQNKKLQGFKVNGRTRIFLKPELDHYLEQRDAGTWADVWSGDADLEAEVIERLMTGREVADLLGITPGAVSNNVELQAIKIAINKHTSFYDRREIEQYIADNQEYQGRGQPRKVPKNPSES